jgi:hypothetical protein
MHNNLDTADKIYNNNNFVDEYIVIGNYLPTFLQCLHHKFYWVWGVSKEVESSTKEFLERICKKYNFILTYRNRSDLQNYPNEKTGGDVELFAQMMLWIRIMLSNVFSYF